FMGDGDLGAGNASACGVLNRPQACSGIHLSLETGRRQKQNNPSNQRKLAQFSVEIAHTVSLSVAPIMDGGLATVNQGRPGLTVVAKWVAVRAAANPDFSPGSAAKRSGRAKGRRSSAKPAAALRYTVSLQRARSAGPPRCWRGTCGFSAQNPLRNPS